MSKENRLSRREFIKGAAMGAAAVAGVGVLNAAPAQAQTQCPSAGVPDKWDKEADLVIAGAGAAGLAAAVEAAELGASVIMIDQNTDVGGLGIISGGLVALGGGTRLQKKQGIQDSPEILYKDLTHFQEDKDDKYHEFKKNDKELVRTFADYAAPTMQWLEDHGVVFGEKVLGFLPEQTGSSAMRTHYTLWDEEGTARSPGSLFLMTGQKSSGAAIYRPLEAVARKKGVQILLQHKLTRIIREGLLKGAVLGIEVENQGKKLYLRGKKGIIIACGGPKGSVNLRTVFDPRLTAEYCPTGEPWAFHTGEGILCAQEIGAQLASDWGLDGHWIQGPRSTVGSRYVTSFLPGSPAYARARATGVVIKDPQNIIRVKKTGLRYANELVANAEAALADGGGPIWAIFDADAVKREKWGALELPNVEEGFFFSGNTIAELAGKIKNEYQTEPMPAKALEETVTKYNSYVDAGKDPDFGRATPKYKIQTPPFYAAWATAGIHDTRAGLRVNGKSQVIDIRGAVIPGLYAGGEAAGGLNQQGNGKAIIQGRVAAQTAIKGAA